MGSLPFWLPAIYIFYFSLLLFYFIWQIKYVLFCSYLPEGPFNVERDLLAIAKSLA